MGQLVPAPESAGPLDVSTSAMGTSLLPFPYTGIYGVGKAALHPPALAILSHTPDGATQTIAWVGKGIVYDTGGLSIKGKVRCGFQGAIQTGTFKYLVHLVSGVGDCFI
jgi:hypothetical protein